MHRQSASYFCVDLICCAPFANGTSQENVQTHKVGDHTNCHLQFHSWRKHSKQFGAAQRVMPFDISEQEQVLLTRLRYHPILEFSCGSRPNVTVKMTPDARVQFNESRPLEVSLKGAKKGSQDACWFLCHHDRRIAIPKCIENPPTLPFPSHR